MGGAGPRQKGASFAMKGCGEGGKSDLGRMTERETMLQWKKKKGRKAPGIERILAALQRVRAALGRPQSDAG